MTRLILAIGAMVAIVLPYAAPSNFYVNVCSEIWIFCIFAASYNLLIGYAGLLSLGHAACFGLGGYVVSIAVVKFGYSDISAILIALAVSMLFALVASALVLRTSGLSFMMTTLAMGQLLWGIAFRWVDMTGGDAGLPGLQRPVIHGIDLNSAPAFYYVSLAVAVAAILLMKRFVDSPFGNCLRGVRDQPRRMDAMGYNVWLIKYAVLLYSALWATVAGILFAYFQRFVSPFNLGIEQEIAPLIMVILGGVATFSGPLMGAAIVVVVERVLSSYVVAWPALLGLGFIATVMFAPNGLTERVAAINWIGRRKDATRPAVEQSA